MNWQSFGERYVRMTWQQQLDQARPMLALRARQMSGALLRMAGLTGTTEWQNN